MTETEIVYQSPKCIGCKLADSCGLPKPDPAEDNTGTAVTNTWAVVLGPGQSERGEERGNQQLTMTQIRIQATFMSFLGGYGWRLYIKSTPPVPPECPLLEHGGQMTTTSYENL